MTNREKFMAVICVLILLLTNLATFNHARAGCPDIQLSCPDGCPEIPSCPQCPDCSLEVPLIVAGPGVQCVMIGSAEPGSSYEVHCDKVEVEPDCPDIDVEVERRHGVKLGPSYIFHEDNDAVGMEVDWDPKWLQQRNPWVPTTVSFLLSEDIGDYAEPTLDYGIEYQQLSPMGRCHYCPTPAIDWQQPDGTRLGVTVKWTAK